MENINQYIESSLSGLAEGKELIKFKNNLVNALTERANELTKRGLNDEKVIYDLIVSEHPDIKKEYNNLSLEKFRKEKAKKEKAIKAVACIAAVLLTVIIFLLCSFVTKAWSKTWLIILAGVTVIISYFVISKSKKLIHMDAMRIAYARALIAADVMLISVFVFLFCFILFSIPKSWLLILFGVAAMLITDGIIATITKQKLAIINYLVYIPSVFAMIYVIFGILGILPWHPGWIIMPISVLIDLFVIIAALIKNSKYTYEEADE